MKHLYQKIALFVLLLLNITFLQSQSQKDSKILVADTAEQFISSFNKTNKAGEQVLNTTIKVSPKETLTLDFNVRKQKGEMLRLVGSVNQNKNSSYNITYLNGYIEGDIILIDKKKAYKIFTSTDSKIYIGETDINSILCIGLPKSIDLPKVKKSSIQKSEKK